MYKITCKDTNFCDFIKDIKKYFHTNTTVIHKARNELKIITYKDTTSVVKSFAIPNLFRRIWYSFFRHSKAKKSFDYSLKIGNFTPEPLGYIEFYRSFLLHHSFFIAKEFHYSFTIREPLLDKNFPEREKIFEEFANFSYQLHQNNILHNDYSPGNILIKKEKQNYIFKIVDINRMSFKPLQIDERLKNFDKLWADDEDLKIIVRYYSKLMGIDTTQAITQAISFSHQLKKRKNIKKRVKGFFKND